MRAPAGQPPLHFGGVYIDGSFVDTRRSIPSEDPSTGQVWSEVTIGGAGEVDLAVKSAAVAQRERWATVSARERGEILRVLAASIRTRKAEFAEYEARDNGKPLRNTDDEIDRACRWLEFFAGAAATIYGRTIPMEAGHEARTYRRPVGVVGAITPWNSPMYLYMWKLAPALACGNSVVLKPSEMAPVTSSLLASCASESGIPDGVLNVVVGLGEEAGAALAGHPEINRLTFTGSPAHGRAAAALAARNFTPATIEAGGKAPLIVLDDADLELAVQVALRGAFRSAGQSCAQLSRVLIHESLYDSFVKGLASAAEKLVIGPALDPATDVGPLITAAAVERCARYVGIARDCGYDILHGGEPASLPGGAGHYFMPTIIGGVEPVSPVFTDEIFGPVVAVSRFKDDEQAVSLANYGVFGLSSCLMTSSLSRAQRITDALDAGIVCVNTYQPGNWLLPYGGRKASGMGFDNGYDVIVEYTEIKTVVLPTYQ